MVSQVRDPYLGIKGLSTLALYLRREDCLRECSEVVNQRILPALLRLPNTDNTLQHRAWISAYPAVWLEDRDQARKSISGFPTAVKDQCISALCYALLRRQPTSEPFDRASRNRRAPLEYADIKHLLRLCEETQEDYTICSVFEWIADEVASTRSTARLTRDQKAEISRSMIDIARRRLPMSHRIQHAGYQILCKTHATRIFETRGISWASLISKAEGLTNSADRIFVLANIASYLPAKQKKKRRSLFEQAEQEADRLVSVEDQFGRYYSIASQAQEKEKSTALRIVRKAFSKVAGTRDGRTTAKERELVDLAQRLNPELPMELAVLYDDDPARQQYRERAKRQLDAHQLRRDIADNRSTLDLTNRHDDRALATASWNALAALNSGRMIPASIQRLRDMLVCASRFPLQTSFPMYSWTLSNLMAKYAQTNEASNYIRNMFEGVLRAATFYSCMTAEKGSFGANPEWQDLGHSGHHLVVKIGERDKALSFICDWLKSDAEDFVTIVDPYFGVEDLDLLLRIFETNSRLDLRIVTGKYHQHKIEGSLPDAYSSAWRHLCDHTPPNTEVLVVGFAENGQAPFHDRWILSKSAGLRLGTSYNGIGNRDSEISVLGSEEVLACQRTVERYQTRQFRESDGRRVAYESFELVP